MADGQIEHASSVVNVMIQGLLQSPDFSQFDVSPAGLTLYYLWTTVTVIILLNVLISLFSSAYEDVVEDAEAEYLAFFAAKTVGMIRAPDEYLYPAPFNIIEVFFIAPYEGCVSSHIYGKLNRFVMRVVFLVPLAVIALYESASRAQQNSWVKDWFGPEDDGDDDSPDRRDPVLSGEDGERGLVISKVPFDELVKVFPNTEQSSEGTILNEINDLKLQITALMKKLDEKGG